MNCSPPLGEMFNERGYAVAPLTAALDGLVFIRDAFDWQIAPGVSQETIEDFVYSLLDRGASVRATDEQLPSTEQSTMLGAAAAMGSYGLVSRIIADGADLHGQ